MMALLASFEQTAFSVWMRESPSLLAFPAILWLHTLGLALLAAYPAKALTNWVFFAKLAMIMLALWVLQRIKSEIDVANDAVERTVGRRARLLACGSLLLWAGTILAGRLLAYTHSILMASDGF